jgi:hypothetical protein
MDTKASVGKCYTCFPYGLNQILCVAGSDEQVVRKYMHPTDNIKHTLWLFEAQNVCMNEFYEKTFHGLDNCVLHKFNEEYKNLNATFSRVDFINLEDTNKS